MSDETYHCLQQTKNIQANKLHGPIENNLIQTLKSANVELEKNIGTRRTQSHKSIPD
jgi:hypothetical protein